MPDWHFRADGFLVSRADAEIPFCQCARSHSDAVVPFLRTDALYSPSRRLRFSVAREERALTFAGLGRVLVRTDHAAVAARADKRCPSVCLLLSRRRRLVRQRLSLPNRLLVHPCVDPAVRTERADGYACKAPRTTGATPASIRPRRSVRTLCSSLYPQRALT